MDIELMDVLDEAGNVVGTATGAEVHAKGLWHRVAHVWFLNEKGELLLQKRSMRMSAYPGCWDMSVGGHITARETSLEAAIRETQEELGLSLPASAFELIFTSKESFTTNQGTYVVNEFQDVYLVHSNLTTGDMTHADGEVDVVQWIPVDEFARWIKEEQPGIVPHKAEYERLFVYLRK